MLNRDRNLGEILSDILSNDAHKVWSGACAIISLGQDHQSMMCFIPYLSRIKDRVKDLELGGILASNERFVSFAIRTIEFHESYSLCSCALYPESKGDCIYKPQDEVEKGNIIILDTVMNEIDKRYVDYYLVQCMKCKQRFKIIEREYHYVWWQWKMI